MHIDKNKLSIVKSKHDIEEVRLDNNRHLKLNALQFK